ncbi:rCG56776 [Rattus norvegicus]|uniref:RCG56776 n=1 Tax=Rattus norvegicus TaxID=10116 RepID=A6KJK0_RAT|nr:rCG56776 [Rattus norvegicus]
MLGESNTADSKPDTIQVIFCPQAGRNIIHSSDSIQNTKKVSGLSLKV